MGLSREPDELLRYRVVMVGGAAADTLASKPTPGGSVRGREVLVIEDNASVRETQVAILEQAGYSVRQATDGFEALELLQQRLPDLIVLDMVLPRLSGWQFLERSEAFADRKRVPVLIISALDPQQVAMSTFGVAAWLTKPVGAERLLRNVEELAGPARPRVLVVDDEPFIRELLAQHLSEEGF